MVEGDLLRERFKYISTSGSVLLRDRDRELHKHQLRAASIVRTREF